MKLEVGMYVRTEYGEISQIKEIDKNNNIYCDSYRVSKTIELLKINETIKSSHNITDLIEVGDYVNGYKVDSTPFYDSGYITFGLSNNTNFDSLCEIKEVLTHEQYEANCYKVGE